MAWCLEFLGKEEAEKEREREFALKLEKIWHSNPINTWDDLIFYTGANKLAECIQCPRNDTQYNAPSVSLYKDGTVWVSGAKGSTQLFKRCPYSIMYDIFMQRYKETNEK